MSHCEYREFWIFEDEEGVFTEPHHEYWATHKLKPIHVREVHPQEAEIKKVRGEAVKNRIQELERMLDDANHEIAILRERLK